MSTRPRGAIFFDRDGTIVRSFGHRPANTVAEIELFPGVAEAFRDLQGTNLAIIMVTNQGGIGLGYMTTETMIEMNNRVNELICVELGIPNHNGIPDVGKVPIIDTYYWCPHKPEAGCNCRKPRAGLFYKAQEDFGLDLSKSYMVGDSPADMDAAVCAGIPRRFLVVHEKYVETPSATVMFPTFVDAAKAIILMEKMR